MIGLLADTSFQLRNSTVPKILLPSERVRNGIDYSALQTQVDALIQIIQNLATQEDIARAQKHLDEMVGKFSIIQLDGACANSKKQLTACKIDSNLSLVKRGMISTIQRDFYVIKAKLY